jgi:hypothetical protein
LPCEHPARAVIRFLYVAGWSHSGSTLLGNILGEIDGFFAAGEVRHIWRRGFLDDELCGCGDSFSACSFWRAVVAQTVGAVGPIDAERAGAMDDRLMRNRRLPELLLAQRDRGREADALREYSILLAALYAAIRSVTGCRVVVDISKSPLYALILAGMPEIDLRVVHLVRDSRGTHFSSLRSASSLPPVLDLLLYDFWHAVSELGLRRRGRYMRVRYEDFARDPVATVRDLVEFSNEPPATLPFIDSRRVVLRPNHNVAGNRNRLRSGEIELEVDEAWRDQLGARRRAFATALTWPILLRHGYLGLRQSKDASAASVS